MLEAVQQMPLATVRHLLVKRLGDSDAPGESTIGSICKHLLNPVEEPPALVEELSEPGPDRGMLITRAGVAMLMPDTPMSPPRGVDAFDWLSQPAVSITDKVRAHVRLTTDLAALLSSFGRVRTEFVSGLLNPRQRLHPASDFGLDGWRRADLLFDVGWNQWAVEIERSEKRSGADVFDRYIDLGVKHAEGRFLTPDSTGGIDGVWYLTNDTPEFFNPRPSKIADRVVRGLFDAAELTDSDLICFVQPVRMDEIAFERFTRRETYWRSIIDEALPVLSQGFGLKPGMHGRSQSLFVVPSSSERKPTNVREPSVILVGVLSSLDVEQAAGHLKVRDREVHCMNLPTDLAVPIHAGDRVVVFGQLDRSQVLKVQHVRRVGVDWERPSQSKSGATQHKNAVIKREQKDAAAHNPRADDGKP